MGEVQSGVGSESVTRVHVDLREVGGAEVHLERRDGQVCVSPHTCALPNTVLQTECIVALFIHDRLWPMILSFTTEEKKMLGLIGMSNADVSAPFYFILH